MSPTIIHQYFLGNTLEKITGSKSFLYELLWFSSMSDHQHWVSPMSGGEKYHVIHALTLSQLFCTEDLSFLCLERMKSGIEERFVQL